MVFSLLVIHHSATFLIQTFSLLEPQNESLPPHPRHLVLGRLLPSAGGSSGTHKKHPVLKESEKGLQFSCSNVAQMCQTLRDPWTTACQASLSIINSRSLLKLICLELVMQSNHLILYHPLSSCLQSSEHQGLSQ